MHVLCRAGLAGTILALFAGAAQAHPHVWISYKVTAIGGREGITKLRFTWEMDPLFTAMVRDEFGLKAVSEKDSAAVKAKAFDNLAHFHYYTDIKADGAVYRPTGVKDFIVRPFGKEAMAYEFTIELPKPSAEVEFSVFDPEFYVDIGPPMQAPRAEKPGIMAVAKYEPKNFISAAGASPPQCEGREGSPRDSMWGPLPVYVVSCRKG